MNQVLNPDNKTLEWCAKWIEDSLRAETNARTVEFGKNMAMTIRAVKTKGATTSDTARLAAEEIHDWIFSAPDSWPIRGEASKAQLAAIIRKHFAAAPADNDAELRHCRTCSCEPCREHDFKEVDRCRYRCIRCHTEKFVSEEESGYPNFKDSEMPLG